ncbi:MAG TPA: hypothetical protein VJN96_24030 [Vicinamibacterales bacterium]|nr:hypothetical protein [Vicinamibacterales bacterium]
MKSILIGSCAAIVLAAVAACGSSGGGTPQTQPSGVPSGGGNANSSTISILGDRGGASFTPNPAPNGFSELAFKNNDTQIHRIVANDGSFDSGDIAPGATKSVALSTDGTNYHCLIHPDMIGAVAANDGAPPKCTGIYC